MGPALQLAIIIFCIIMSAYFSATETAFSTFNKIRVKGLAEKGNKRAASALKLSENYDTLLSAILIGNNLVNILSTSLATMLFVSLLKSNDLGATVSTVVMTVVVLIFGEISPKTIAKKRPEAFVLFAAPIIKGIMVVLTPFTFLFKQWQNLIAKLIKSNDEQGITEEELVSIIEEAEESGDIDKEESTLIKSAIEFNDLEVGDIFTPRIDITAVPSTATKAEVATVFTESGYSRLPVYENDIDNIVGIVYYKDFFPMGKNNVLAISDILKPVMYFAKSQPVNDLLKELQSKQLHLAVVMDEFGSTAGIVTLEDILEEIVGEIWDEHDEIVEEIKEVGEKEYIISGMTNISKFFDLFDIDEECESSTVNGWAMTVLEKIPEVGDSFEELGLQVEVLEMDGKRIENVRVVDVRVSEEDEDEKDKKDKDRDSEEYSDNKESEK